MSEEKLTDREIADKILNAIKEQYGFIPLVNQVLSERPDLFIPSAKFGKAVLEGDEQKLEKKTAYLCAISAATALGAEHCLNVQMKHAVEAGATKDEILETMLIGSFMAMTRAQSYAFRKYDEMFGGKD
ncbi:MAG: carboxymuconolactone decarboxylase family protein [Candidatus Methanomethylophilaceae archaeon]|nr:carboxymuconolactone decarboxylase family protein [Candidatus Methanomethylophilaceae archaeon]